jgi:Icc-related predicted phosphoesterase
MRILAVSDKEVEFLYSPSVRDGFHDIDLIVGCGDLSSRYLEYIVTQLNVPLVYVPGNHDEDNLNVPGGRPLDGQVVYLKGLTIAGLGGSRRYKMDGRHQYTETEMTFRILQLAPRLSIARARWRRGLDVLITHAPPLQIHDGSDLPHMGFAGYRRFLQTFRPRLMLHGHSHSNRNLEETVTLYEGCQVVNVYPYRLIDLEVA